MYAINLYLNGEKMPISHCRYYFYKIKSKLYDQKKCHHRMADMFDVILASAKNNSEIVNYLKRC